MTLKQQIARWLWESAHALSRSTEGQDLIEYALITGFIVVAVVTLSPEIAQSFSTVWSKVDSVTTLAAGS
jgi:pilus assembly protein Flp/PilA